MLKQFTIDSLNNLFDFLCQQPDLIFWIRSSDYQRQIFVSPSFETICQRKCDQLYEHPQSFFDMVISHHRQDLLNTVDVIVSLENSPVDDNQMFQMIRPNGQLVGFKQTIFSLLNNTGQHVGFAGIGNFLSDVRWHEEFQLWQKREDKPFDSTIKNEIFSLLHKEAKIGVLNQEVKNAKLILKNEERPIDITKREHQCLKHLMQGFSAKHIARSLNISSRTVEFHSRNLKDKAGCRTIAELIASIAHIREV